MTQLFRPEAVDAQRQQWLGRVQLVRPVPLAWLTALALAIAAATAAWLAWGTYTRKAPAVGLLVPDRGLIRLVPPTAGTVLERQVEEGQAVRAGELLFVLGLPQPTLDAPAQAQLLASVEERRLGLQAAVRQERALAESRRSTLDARLAALAREQEQIDTELSLHRERLARGQATPARPDALREPDVVSPARLPVREDETLALQAQGRALERQRAALARERAEIEDDRRRLPLETDARAGALAREQAALAREAVEVDGVRRLLVRAPQDAVVTAVLAESGQSVGPSSALAGLMPAGARLQAQLYANAAAIGSIRPGQAVRLRYEAFPHARFGHRTGRVLQVARAPLSPGERAALALPHVARATESEPLFRVTVALDDDPGLPPLPLVPGMRLQAEVMLETRRLVEWLFEPALGLSRRL